MKENLFSQPLEQVEEESKSESAKTGNLACFQETEKKPQLEVIEHFENLFEDLIQWNFFK